MKLRLDFTKKLGERIRQIRNEKEMTQQKLAEKAFLHLTYIGHLEQGKYHPTVFVMWKIANALDVGIDDLL